MFYAVLIYIFVLFMTAFVLMLFNRSTKQRRGCIVIPVTEIDDPENIKRLVKELYYEEILSGKGSARQIILACTHETDISSLQMPEMAECVIEDELLDRLFKKEKANEQYAVK